MSLDIWRRGIGRGRKGRRGEKGRGKRREEEGKGGGLLHRIEEIDKRFKIDLYCLWPIVNQDLSFKCVKLSKLETRAAKTANKQLFTNTYIKYA